MSSHPGGELYFIALVPTEPVYHQAWEIKEYFSEHYESHAALKSPPHVTLHMPFRVKENKEHLLIELMEERLRGMTSFEVNLNGYGCFPPRVIYIEVEQNNFITDLYRHTRRFMQKFLHLDNADWKNRGFTPHLTVAFRDLKKEKFQKAWNEFEEKTFLTSWQASEVSLLKHTGKEWKVFRRFQFTEK